MGESVEQYDASIRSGARRLTGYRRRSFQAEVATTLCGGCAGRAERRFGWGRETVEKGMYEQQRGMRCLENFAARGRQRSEDRALQKEPAVDLALPPVPTPQRERPLLDSPHFAI